MILLEFGRLCEAFGLGKTPQRHNYTTPKQLPTPNAQNCQVKKKKLPGTKPQLRFLAWAFWALRVGL
jgi:hypothetical protein